MLRFIVTDRRDRKLREIQPNQVLSLVRHDAINGERSLELETTQEFIVGDRVVYQDGAGVWREYVVYGLEQMYRYGAKDVYRYYCVWSIQHDLSGTVVSSMPGVQNPVSASVALDAALAGTNRWTRGTVDVTGTAGASMWMMQGWNAISVLLKNWGGELDSTITVTNRKVDTRKADLLQHIGSTTAKHRFDLGFDVKSVKRVQEDGPLVCRIIPLGKGEQSGDGYGRKITIESVNSGRNYLTYTPMQDTAELPYSLGGSTVAYEYPTIIVENPDCETPSDLKTWAEAHIAEFCTPKISYVVDVVAATAEGLNLDGLSLGDVVHVADEQLASSSTALRLEARVVAMDVDELTGKSTSITIGSITENLSNNIGGIEHQVSAMSEKVDILSNAATGTPTLASGVAYDSDTRFVTSLVKYGSIVVLSAALMLTGSSAHFSKTYTNIMTLPTGFRPTTRFFVPSSCGSSIWNTFDESKVQFETNGNVSVYCNTSRTDVNRVQFVAVFPV